MRLELHLLQSFPPSNLNRDENGMQKTATFGGRVRARISSQCQKRAVRFYYRSTEKFGDLISRHSAERSRTWLPELRSRLVSAGIESSLAQIAAKLSLVVLGAKFDGDEIKSKIILFLGRLEIEAIASILVDNWASIEPLLTEEKPALPKEPNISKAIEKALIDGAKPGDVALFGRMMASLPTVNVDAAVQMAHAIGVNSISQEFDFFTAVDDLAKEHDHGADHMGETGFNSSVYYRYACLDAAQLLSNLGGSSDAPAIVCSFADAFVRALPSGFQNSFAAHSLPGLVLAVVRRGQPISLVDAFESPVRATGGLSVLQNAVRQVDSHWAEMAQMYGFDDISFKGLVVRPSLEQYLDVLQPARVSSVELLIDQAVSSLFLAT